MVLGPLVLVWGFALSPSAQDPLDRRRRDEARRHYEAGEELMSGERFEAAAAQFRAAIALDPDLVLAHYSLGQSLMPLRRYAEAVAAYTNCRETILRRASLDQRARFETERRRQEEIRELEDSLQRQRNGEAKRSPALGPEVAIEERIRVLKNLEMRDGEDTPRVPAEVSLALGSALFRLGQLAGAEKEYRAALAADPKHGAAHNNLAVVYMMTGRLEQARDSVRRAEKAGFQVSPAFKKDLQQQLQAAESR